MRTIIIGIFIFIPILLVSQQNKSFVISGLITNAREGEKVYLKRVNMQGRADIIGEAVLAGGKFILKGTLEDSPELCYLFLKDQKDELAMFLDNGNIKIEGDIISWPKLKVNGSSTQADYEYYKKVMDSVWREWDSIKEAFEGAQRKGDMLTRNIFTKQFEENSAKALVIKREFIKQRPKSPLVPFIVLKMRTNNNDSIDLAFRNDIYLHLPQTVQKSSYGIKLKNQIQLLTDRSLVKLGNIIPDFSSYTPDGKLLSVKSIYVKSQVTLIDFWASWCAPCRGEIPNLRKVYEAFRNKGFNILSISFDFKEKNWKDAIAKDTMPWLHASQLKGREEDAGKLFGINGIPAAILVNNEGKIIAIDAPSAAIKSAGGSLRGEALYKKIEAFFERL